MFVVIPGAPEIIEAIQPLLDHCPSSASCCLVAICIKGSFVIRVDCIDTANSLTAFEKLSTVPGCWKKKNQSLVGLITCIRERAWNKVSFQLLVHLFIYLSIFFFVLLGEFADLLVAMGHVLMCEIKTSWVEEFGGTWANKVVKRKIESAESKLSSGNDICSFEPGVERNQAKNRRVKLLVTRVHVTACNIITEPCGWVLWRFTQVALRWVPRTEEKTKNQDCLRQVSLLLQVNVLS